MSTDINKLSHRSEDWIKTTLLYEQGGYGYIACSLQKEANFRLHISIDERYSVSYVVSSRQMGINC